MLKLGQKTQNANIFMQFFLKFKNNFFKGVQRVLKLKMGYSMEVEKW